MHKTSVVLCIVASLLGPSCTSRRLEREQAAKMIAAHSSFAKSDSIFLADGTYCEPVPYSVFVSKSIGSVDESYEPLAAGHLYQLQLKSAGVASITAPRILAAADAAAKCDPSRTKQKTPDGSLLMMPHWAWRVELTREARSLVTSANNGHIVIGNAVVPEVTGITFSDNDKAATVEFLWTMEPTTEARQLGVERVHGGEGRASLRLYDDGWRVLAVTRCDGACQ